MVEKSSFNHVDYYGNIDPERPDKILLGSNPGHSERIREESELHLGIALLIGETDGLSHAISKHVNDYHDPEKEYIFGDKTVAKVLRNFLDKFKPNYKAKLLANALNNPDPKVAQIARKIAPPVEIVSDDDGGSLSSEDSDDSIET